MIRKTLVALPLLMLLPLPAIAAPASAPRDGAGPPTKALAEALGLTEAQVSACFGAMAPPDGKPAGEAGAPPSQDAASADAMGAPPQGGMGGPPDSSALLACLQKADPSLDAAKLDAAMAKMAPPPKP